jgi:hypothetical protein
MSKEYSIEETQALARAALARMDKLVELEAVRAFVERVMIRLSEKFGSVPDPKLGELLMGAIRDEVDAMEKKLK